MQQDSSHQPNTAAQDSDPTLSFSQLSLFPMLAEKSQAPDPISLPSEAIEPADKIEVEELPMEVWQKIACALKPC